MLRSVDLYKLVFLFLFFNIIYIDIDNNQANRIQIIKTIATIRNILDKNCSSWNCVEPTGAKVLISIM